MHHSLHEQTLTSSVTLNAPVYFIADAHLGGGEPDAERAKSRDLVELLTALRGAASHLYLVGDIFDFWFEYPFPTPIPYPDVLEALASLSAEGTSVHFLGGNHDYWAGRRLARLIGGDVHRRPIVATHFSRRLFIAHGDGLPQGDLGYRMLRAIIRSPIAIAGFSLIPPRLGAAIARWASGLSEITEKRIDLAVPPMLEFMRGKLESGFDAVVVGHVHRQIVRRWEGRTGVVIGDWTSTRSVVELTPSGFRTLRWSEGRLVGSETR